MTLLFGIIILGLIITILINILLGEIAGVDDKSKSNYLKNFNWFKDKIKKLKEEYKSYDLWEENEGIHTYSLAAIFSSFETMLKVYEIIKSYKEIIKLP